MIQCIEKPWARQLPWKERRRARQLPKKIRSGLSRVYPGRPGSGSTRRVDRVSPGQLPSEFLPPPGRVPGPGRLGLGSARRAGPGFKTLVEIEKTIQKNKIVIKLCLVVIFKIK
jgi:hypothetical protein